MRKIRALAMAFYIVCGLLWSGTEALAAESGKLESESGAETVRGGEQLTLVFSLDGYDEITDGINAVKGSLQYDPAFFEDIEAADFETLSGWENLYYNPDNGQFVLMKRGGSTESEQLFRMTLTARGTLPAGGGQVEITDLSVSEGKEDLFPSGAAFAFWTVPGEGEAAEPAGEKGAQAPEAGSVTGSMEGEAGEAAEEKGQLSDSAESGTAYAVPEENLPVQEAAADQIMTAAGLAVFLALAAAAAFFFFRRQKRKTGTLLAGILICGAAAALLGGSVSALRGKGDLNGDGMVDYADVRLLKQHLTAIGLLSEEGTDRADMDGSGALTITDLSLLIRRVENRLDYTVSVSPVLEQFYFEKGEEVPFRFQAEVPYGAWIERVMIDGEVYEVQNGLDSSVYTVMVPAGSAAGIRTYQMTKAYLNTGREAEADCRVSVDVLKTAPEVEAFAVEERTDTAQMQVSFTLRDEDAALSSASAEVLEKESGERILTETLAAGEQELLLDLEEDREYLFHIAADYRRDSGLLEVPADHSGSISAVKEMALGIDYQFAFGGMETAAEDGTRTAVFSKNQPVVLTFQSSNATVYHPDRIVVNGRTYPAERSGSGYSVTLAPFEKTGTAEIRAEQLVLENGKVFRLDENQKVAVEIQKERPQFDGLSVKEEIPGRQMRVAFQLTDPDGALQNCRVLIQTAEGQRAAELPFGAADLEADRLEAVIPLIDTSLTSSYTVQVLADWDLSPDGNRTELQKILGGMQIQAAPRMEIAGGRAGSLYAEKNGTAELFFELRDNVEAELTGLVVNGELLAAELQPDGSWKAAGRAAEEAGKQEFLLSRAVYADGTQTEGTYRVFIEVLKDIPSVEAFSYEKTGQDELRVEFVLEDPDGALQSALAWIEEEGGAVLGRKTVQAGAFELAVPLGGGDRYRARVTASYDRDSGLLEEGANEYVEEEIFSETVTASRDVIQFKNVIKERLYYREENGSSREISMLDIRAGLPEDVSRYYAVIEMEELPDFYGGIREFRQEPDTGRVYAVLEQPDLVRYETDGSRSLEYAIPLAYADDGGEHPLVKSAEELFREMAADPRGDYVLTEDLDASAVPDSAAAVAGTFSGTLDGNGYRILNLKTSLFETLNGAEIRDLVIEKAAVTAGRRGILADYIRGNSVIEQVFLVDSSIANGVDGMGAFAGELTDSVIRKSASLNGSVKGLVAAGGLVGKTGAGAIMEDCYVTGKVEGTYNHPSLGSRAGGIAGWHGGGVIRRCYTAVQIIAPEKKGNGGIIGGPNTGSPSIEYSLSMSTGTAYRIAGFDVLNGVQEVYEYSGSGSATNITEENREQVKTADDLYSRGFYRDTLGFDESVWNLEELAYGKRPGLNSAPMSENRHQIPEYEGLRRHEHYRADRETAYANLAKLMPFADTCLWVKYGNDLDQDDALVSKMLRFVLPLDADGALAAGVLKDSPGEVQRLRLVYEDHSQQEYDLSYQKLTGGLAAVYQIKDRGLPYQFHHYAAELDEILFGELLRLAEGYDYTADLAVLTEEEESRLYRDYYEETVKPGLAELLKKILISQESYPVYGSHPAVKALGGERLLRSGELKKLLYAYNYYDKWYRVDYDGILLSELMFFRGREIARGLTAETLTEALLAAPAARRETNRTVEFYNAALKSYTGEGLTEFLGGLAVSLAGYQDPAQWFADGFGGVLVEKAAMGDSGAIRYRLWDNLNGLEDGRRSIVLPILTAPQEDMYLISVPSQILIGSMNRYPDYLNKDGGERERMRQTAELYAEKMSIFYGISSRWMSGAGDRLNRFVNIQYDTRLAFPESSAAAAGEQKKDETRDPVMKWVYEANNTISALNGSAAVADGANVYWMWDAALGTSDYLFFVFSHETAHNQDGRYFYGDAGRRKGTGAEAHADGNIAQEMRDGCMVFNISKINDIGVEMTNNFSYERIDSADRLHSYYREMLETGYVLDYLAAQAFLKLTPKEQAAVAVQAEHIPAGNNSMRTVYRRMTEAEMADLNLTDMADLWDNRISVRNAASYPESVNTATDGSYGFESFYTMNWYQSHNDSGSPDTHSFKRLGQEMLGLAGYEKGYMVYMSALSENDLEALRMITGNPDMTWREYKLGRYRQVAEKLDRIPYFEAETVIGQFQKAFEDEAATGNQRSIETKRMLYGMVKRVTGDFSDGGIFQSSAVIPVSSAQELIRLAKEKPFGFYRLEQDLDFSGIEAAGGSYLPQRFIGILDGNGHQLTGMRYPLFGDLQYAQVKDLVIDVSAYEAAAQAVLAVSTKKTVIGNVRAETAVMLLPLVKTAVEGYYEYGDTTVTVGEQKIMTLEEFLAIGASGTALKRKYVLGADLDFGGSVGADHVVSGVFSGELSGGGHTIRGLDAALFEELDGAVIRDLSIEGIRLVRDAQKGALAGRIRNSQVEQIRVSGLVIENGASQVGGLAGQITGSRLKRIALENISVKARDTVGGLAGQFDGLLLEDCLVTGRLEGTLVHPMGARIGGITGWLGDGILRNCLTRVEIAAPERIGNGGIIGGPQTGSAAVEASLSLSTGVNANRISGWNVLGITSSAYELESSDSESNLSPETEHRVFSATEEETREPSFYMDILGWSEAIWSFDRLAAEGIPSLR